MRTLAIANHKGGVTKTATAHNLGAVVALEHERRVLLVDADLQASLTGACGVRGELMSGHRLGQARFLFVEVGRTLQAEINAHLTLVGVLPTFYDDRPAGLLARQERLQLIAHAIRDAATSEPPAFLAALQATAGMPANAPTTESGDDRAAG